MGLRRENYIPSYISPSAASRLILPTLASFLDPSPNGLLALCIHAAASIEKLAYSGDKECSRACVRVGGGVGVNDECVPRYLTGFPGDIMDSEIVSFT
jgi:hypothetical protein